jgi:hypothetical protein
MPNPMLKPLLIQLRLWALLIASAGCLPSHPKGATIPLVERLSVLSNAERQTTRSGNSEAATYNIPGAKLEAISKSVLQELNSLGFSWVYKETNRQGRIVLRPSSTELSGGPTMITISPGFDGGANGELFNLSADGCNVTFFYVN